MLDRDDWEKAMKMKSEVSLPSWQENQLSCNDIVPAKVIESNVISTIIADAPDTPTFPISYFFTDDQLPDRKPRIADIAAGANEVELGLAFEAGSSREDK